MGWMGAVRRVWRDESNGMGAVGVVGREWW